MCDNPFPGLCEDGFIKRDLIGVRRPAVLLGDLHGEVIMPSEPQLLQMITGMDSQSLEGFRDLNTIRLTVSLKKLMNKNEQKRAKFSISHQMLIQEDNESYSRPSIMHYCKKVLIFSFLTTPF